MQAIIELDQELLVDRSQIPNPCTRLLLDAIGRPLAFGSPWLVVNKEAASVYNWPAGSLACSPRTSPDAA